MTRALTTEHACCVCVPIVVCLVGASTNASSTTATTIGKSCVVGNVVVAAINNAININVRVDVIHINNITLKRIINHQGLDTTIVVRGVVNRVRRSINDRRFHMRRRCRRYIRQSVVVRLDRFIMRVRIVSIRNDARIRVFNRIRIVCDRNIRVVIRAHTIRGARIRVAPIVIMISKRSRIRRARCVSITLHTNNIRAVVTRTRMMWIVAK